MLADTAPPLKTSGRADRRVQWVLGTEDTRIDRGSMYKSRTCLDSNLKNNNKKKYDKLSLTD